ncbi:MAG: Gfo/Idh/MocA family protein [Spirochaetota bacterium]
MSTTQLRAAVIGLGWAGQQHIKAYQALSDTIVTAIAEPNPTLLEQVKQEFGIENGFNDYREMLEWGEIDVVSVGTPNFAHAEPAIDALDHKMHVLVEKPLARTYAEGVEMVRAAERNDRILQVMFNQRYRPDVQVMKRFIDDGGLGEIYHAKSRWLRRSGIPGRGRKWFVSHELAGGGPLIDLGVHMLDMALYAMGEPKVEAVSGASYNHLGQRFVTDLYGEDAKYEVEDFATSLIRIEGGRTLQLEASWATYRPDGDLMNLMLYGNHGGAEMTTRNYEPQGAVKFFVDSGGVPAEILPEVPSTTLSTPGHQRAAATFIERVLSGNYSDHRGREGLLRTWIIDAIYRSAAEGREIRLDELKDEA